MMGRSVGSLFSGECLYRLVDSFPLNVFVVVDVDSLEREHIVVVVADRLEREHRDESPER